MIAELIISVMAFLSKMEFAKSLEEQHPDVVKVIWRFNRWHHSVNFNPFKKNKLIKKEGLVIPNCINNYGMILKEFDEKMHISKILKSL